MAKVTRIANIMQDLQLEVEELQDRNMLSTPPEVLEERRREASEAFEKISSKFFFYHFGSTAQR